MPGIPKNKLHNHKKQKSKNLLPPPPTAAKATMPSSKTRHSDEAVLRKKQLASASQSFLRDPFFAAFVECSKDGGADDEDRESNVGYWTGAKVGRSVSERFGLINLYASCKKNCAVSESIVYLPTPRRTAYGLITHRSR